jgi:signal peptidase I
VDLEFDFEKRYRLVREIIETLVLTVLMFLIIRLAVQNFNIDGMSMEPSLHNEELVLVDKWSYMLHAPSRGDVVVFIAPPTPSLDFVKRVIGVPGDVVTVRGTQVSVNGALLNETYVDPHRQGNQGAQQINFVIPKGAYFVLGDNRGGSFDSRSWGCVPSGNIIGRAALVYWPLGQDNNGFLPGVASVFQQVGPPPTQGTNQLAACPVDGKLLPGVAMTPHTMNSSTAGAGAIASASDIATVSSFSSLHVNDFFLLILPSVVVGYTSRKRRIE